MEQEEKEQRLIGFASNFISLNDKRPHKQHYTESELADYMIYFAKSEAAKAYWQPTINVSGLTAKLKKWRKETGCNNSDEIIYFILSELK